MLLYRQYIVVYFVCVCENSMSKCYDCNSVTIRVLFPAKQ